MRNKKGLIAIFSIAIASACALVSCDPWVSFDVYLYNATSETIVFRAIQKEQTDSVDVGCNIEGKDSVVLASGERVILFQDGEYGSYLSREDMPNHMKYAYPYGIQIEFETGEPYTYYPDSADSDFHSPYNYRSFSYHENKKIHEVTYNVLY